MAEAEWMLRTGLTTEDWNNLSATDAETLVLHYSLNKYRLIEIISYGVAKGLSMAFSKKREGMS